MRDMPSIERETENKQTRRLGGAGRRRAAVAGALLALAAGGAWLGQDYWVRGRFLQSTDDAYVQADASIVAPKVAGYISAELVNDNQHVRAGQVLARIDDRDFRAARDQSRANLAATAAAVTTIEAQIALQRAEIDAAAANVAGTSAALRFAVTDAVRYHALAQTGFGTVQRAEQTVAARDQLNAALRANANALIAAQRRIAVLVSDHAQALANLDRARAALHQAELNLSYTVVLAPVDGTVGARTLRVGQYVSAGTQLMALVPLDAAYIIANYKETQLARVRPGQTVTIDVDTYSGVRIRGHVDSLAPASGLEFALLPPDNATGNFTKIVQRIPVKIVIDQARADAVLRPGMSVEPTIDTRAAARVD